MWPPCSTFSARLLSDLPRAKSWEAEPTTSRTRTRRDNRMKKRGGKGRMMKQTGGEKKTQRRRRRRHICRGAAPIITPNGFCLAECTAMQPVWSGCCIATHAKIRKKIYLKKKCTESSRQRRQAAGAAVGGPTGHLYSGSECESRPGSVWPVVMTARPLEKCPSRPPP